MEDMIPCPADPEVFQRVWQRVMGDRPQESCPVQPAPSVGEGDLSCACLEALMRQGGAGLPPECRAWEEGASPERVPPMGPEPSLDESAPAGEVPAPEPPAADTGEGLPPENGPDRGNDLPRLWEEPQSADERTARLRHQVMEALEGWQFYRHLSRRARGADARVLNSLAAEQHQHAQKLSAAYFLLTGLRYWPTQLLGTPSIPSYWGALRQRHQSEQRQESAYRLAADDWEDQDMLELYGGLADACLRRAQQLRGLLERGMS